MPILMPEKTIMAALASGLQTIKDNPDIIDDIFDVDTLGTAYIDKVRAYLPANKVYIGQGHAIDDTRLPGWYVIPANLSPDEQFVGSMILDDEVAETDIFGDEVEGEYHRYNARVISASTNGDVTMFLEAVARYILIQSQRWAEENGLMELTVAATDFDPIYQYLPQHLFYRSTTLGFRGISTWRQSYIIIRETELYVKFDPNEDFLMV